MVDPWGVGGFGGWGGGLERAIRQKKYSKNSEKLGKSVEKSKKRIFLN